MHRTTYAESNFERGKPVVNSIDYTQIAAEIMQNFMAF